MNPIQTTAPAFLPEIVRVAALEQQASLVHGFATRLGGVTRCYGREGSGGDLNLGFTRHDDGANVIENRLRFLRALGATDFRAFGLLQQRHTPDVRIIRHLEDAAPDFTMPALDPGDGLITDLPGVLLTVQTADCVPVLVFDPNRRVVAAFHAGWRGTVARIVERGIATMCDIYDSRPADLIAAVGPSIGPESYIVGEDVYTGFCRDFTYAEDLFRQAETFTAARPQLHLDLWEANRRQLLDAGVASESISVTGNDTATDTDRFFSHRTESGLTGRAMAAIGMMA